MKAAVIEEPNKLVVRDLPDPQPTEYQALVQLLFGAVCSGTDNHLVAGHKPFTNWFKFPAVLGHESIGRVLKVGAKVRNFKSGDLITRVGTTAVGGVNIAWGGFAELGIATDWQAMKADGVPQAQWNSARVQHVLPPGTDPAAATMIITWRETYSFLTRIGFKAGQNLLVIGSGGNALSYAVHGRNLGAAKVVVAGSLSRKEVAAQLGAELVDYRSEKPAEDAAKLCPDGFDVIIDGVGRNGGLNPFMPLLKVGGTIAIYGLDDIAGYCLTPMAGKGSFHFYRGGYDEAESHDAIMAFVQQGKLQARPFLTNMDNPFPLERICEALESVRRRECVKALVKLSK